MKVHLLHARFPPSHNYEEVEDMPASVFCFAQRNLDIISEPADRDEVPAPPEFRNGTGNVLIIVLIEVNPNIFPRPMAISNIRNRSISGRCDPRSQPGHPAVSGMSGAEPLHVPFRTQKRDPQSAPCCWPAAPLPVRDKAYHTVGKVLQVLLPLLIWSVWFRLHNWSGDELRKEGDIPRIQEVSGPRRPTVHVNYVIA